MPTRKLSTIAQQQIELLEVVIKRFETSEFYFSGICSVLRDIQIDYPTHKLAQHRLISYISNCLSPHIYYHRWLEECHLGMLDTYVFSVYDRTSYGSTPFTERNKMFQEARIAWMKEMIRLLNTGEYEEGLQ